MKRMYLKVQVKEIWKEIKNYTEYAVSSFGRIMRIKDGHPQSRTKAGKILKPRKMENGYWYITIYESSKRKDFRIHRLVAEHFIGPCPKDYEVNHIDADKSNNHYFNLEYVTHKENIEHAKRLDLYARGEGVSISKLNKTKVKLIRLVHKMGLVSMKELAIIFEVHRTTIEQIIRNQTWKHVQCILE